MSLNSCDNSSVNKAKTMCVETLNVTRLLVTQMYKFKCNNNYVNKIRKTIVLAWTSTDHSLSVKPNISLNECSKNIQLVRSIHPSADRLSLIFILNCLLCICSPLEQRNRELWNLLRKPFLFSYRLISWKNTRTSNSEKHQNIQFRRL